MPAKRPKLYYDAMTGPVAVAFVKRVDERTSEVRVIEDAKLYKAGERIIAQNHWLVNLTNPRINQKCVTADLSKYE